MTADDHDEGGHALDPCVGDGDAEPDARAQLRLALAHGGEQGVRVGHGLGAARGVDELDECLVLRGGLQVDDARCVEMVPQLDLLAIHAPPSRAAPTLIVRVVGRRDGW